MVHLIHLLGDVKEAHQILQQPKSRLTIAITVAIFILFVVVSRFSEAAIIAAPQSDESLQPSVVEGTGGNPTIVYVQPADQHGLSHNKFVQFDVDTNGVILGNNRKEEMIGSGDLIPANPRLAAEATLQDLSPKVILNEVLSSDRSRLNGFIEVLGSNADVIIMNPSGIDCNDCGFINVKRATLTTGTPVFENEQLVAFQVNGGDINIQHYGMNAKRPKHIDLLARTIQVDGKVSAHELALIAGRYYATRELSKIEPLEYDGSEKPLQNIVIADGKLNSVKHQQIATYEPEPQMVKISSDVFADIVLLSSDELADKGLEPVEHTTIDIVSKEEEVEKLALFDMSPLPIEVATLTIAEPSDLALPEPESHKKEDIIAVTEIASTKTAVETTLEIATIAPTETVAETVAEIATETVVEPVLEIAKTAADSDAILELYTHEIHEQEINEQELNELELVTPLVTSEIAPKVLIAVVPKQISFDAVKIVSNSPEYLLEPRAANGTIEQLNSDSSLIRIPFLAKVEPLVMEDLLNRADLSQKLLIADRQEPPQRVFDLTPSGVIEQRQFMIIVQ